MESGAVPIGHVQRQAQGQVWEPLPPLSASLSLASCKFCPCLCQGRRPPRSAQPLLGLSWLKPWSTPLPLWLCSHSPSARPRAGKRGSWVLIPSLPPLDVAQEEPCCVALPQFPRLDECQLLLSFSGDLYHVNWTFTCKFPNGSLGITPASVNYPDPTSHSIVSSWD